VTDADDVDKSEQLKAAVKPLTSAVQSTSDQSGSHIAPLPPIIILNGFCAHYHPDERLPLGHRARLRCCPSNWHRLNFGPLHVPPSKRHTRCSKHAQCPTRSYVYGVQNTLNRYFRRSKTPKLLVVAQISLSVLGEDCDEGLWR
jgi:hypothetical protein